MGSSVRRTGPPLARFAKKLRELPRVVGQKVAERGASRITSAAQRSFDAGQTAFSETRPLGTQGNKVTLVKDGTLRATALQFRHDGGTRIRSAFALRYMGVMVGRFGILPGGGDPLPQDWSRTLAETTREVASEEMGSDA